MARILFSPPIPSSTIEMVPLAAIAREGLKTPESASGFFQPELKTVCSRCDWAVITGFDGIGNGSKGACSMSRYSKEVMIWAILAKRRLGKAVVIEGCFPVAYIVCIQVSDQSDNPPLEQTKIGVGKLR